MRINQHYLALALLSSYITYAGSMGDKISEQNPQRYFLAVGSGISFANNAHPTIVDYLWSDAIEGYSAQLGEAPLYSALLGYNISNAINIDISYTFRGLYNYKKFQTSPPSVTNQLSSRTRYYDLSSNALLFDITLDGGIYPALKYNLFNNGFIQPFVGAGLGVSYNTVSNFHTILSNSSVVTSTALDKTKASLAYQFNAGLEWVFARFSFDIGYRYFNAGSYQSNNYLLTNYTGPTQSSSVASPKATIPWKDTFSANEIFFTAKIAI